MELYSRYKLKSRQLLGGHPSGNTQNATSVFIAYRFRNAASEDFRRTLQAQMGSSDALCDVEVTDGHVSHGEPWLPVIRGRIQKSRLVVADMTNLSPEVLFETGLAWGANKPIIPVVEETDALCRLPHWLTDLQIGCFRTKQGFSDVLDSINKRLFLKRREFKGNMRAKPVPEKAIWLRGTPDFELYRDSLVNTVNRNGLILPDDEDLPPSLDRAEESLINEICRASLMVACLSNSPSDSFIHFAAGTVVSTPTAGAASEKLFRRVVLAVPDNLRIPDVLSDSASRCGRTVKGVCFRELSQEFLNWGKAYRRYRDKMTTPDEGKPDEN